LARAYLVVMASISLDDLQIFMVSLQIRVESLSPSLKNDNGFVVNHRDNVPFALEMLDEFLKGFLFLLHNVRLVPVDSWPLAGGSEVADELTA
jgi:hypothetical protein